MRTLPPGLSHLVRYVGGALLLVVVCLVLRSLTADPPELTDDGRAALLARLARIRYDAQRSADSLSQVAASARITYVAQRRKATDAAGSIPPHRVVDSVVVLGDSAHATLVQLAGLVAKQDTTIAAMVATVAMADTALAADSAALAAKDSLFAAARAECDAKLADAASRIPTKWQKVGTAAKWFTVGALASGAVIEVVRAVVHR